MKTKKNNGPGSPGWNNTDPVEALYGALDELTAIYEEAGVPPISARSAALADFECDFGLLALAA